MIQELIDKAIDYKRRIARSYQSVTSETVLRCISGNTLIVTIKMDGEFNLLHFDGSTSTLINSNGILKTDLPILTTVTQILTKKKIKSLVAVVELHTDSDRPRVFQLMSALTEKPEGITISVFDLLEIDSEAVKTNYQERLEQISSIFDQYAIENITLQKSELLDFYQAKVVDNNHEGLIVRSDEFPIVYKVKPKHDLDLVVVGYTVKEDGIRELLLAAMDENEDLIIAGIVGTGLSLDVSKHLLNKLSDIHAPSKYIEVDKRGVAFQMVEPTTVVQIVVNDLLSETTKSVIKKSKINFHEDSGYAFISTVPSVSFIHPIFKSIREDKKVNTLDVRLKQLSDITYLGDTSIPKQDFPKSQVIFREAYSKVSKGATSVRKFLLIKTNKETIDDSYPAYVLHYSDYSANRKEPLEKEVKISNSEEQIKQLLAESLEKNIKKGWEKVYS